MLSAIPIGPGAEARGRSDMTFRRATTAKAVVCAATSPRYVAVERRHVLAVTGISVRAMGGGSQPRIGGLLTSPCWAACPKRRSLVLSRVLPAAHREA